MALKIVATLTIDTKSMSPELIWNVWVNGPVPNAANLIQEIADVFTLDPSEIELRIRGEIIFSNDRAIIEIDCSRMDKVSFTQISTKPIQTKVWTGLAFTDIEHENIRVEIKYLQPHKKAYMHEIVE